VRILVWSAGNYKSEFLQPPSTGVAPLIFFPVYFDIVCLIRFLFVFIASG